MLGYRCKWNAADLMVVKWFAHTASGLYWSHFLPSYGWMSLTILSHSKANSGSHLRSTGESTPCHMWISQLGRYFELGAWGSFLLLTAVLINSLRNCDNPALLIFGKWRCYLSWNWVSPCVRLVQKLFSSNGDKMCCWVFSRTALWDFKDRIEFWPYKLKLLGFFWFSFFSPVVLKFFVPSYFRLPWSTDQWSTRLWMSKIARPSHQRSAHTSSFHLTWSPLPEGPMYISIAQANQNSVGT